jgi:hypothetical protein
VNFADVGILILAMHAVLAALVALSLKEAARRGSVVAGTLYLLVAMATIAWIWKATEWLR